MERHVTIPVHCDGTRVVTMRLPAIVDERGDAFVTLDDALRWERRHQVNIAMMRSSKIPRRLRKLFGHATTIIPAGDASLITDRSGLPIEVARAVGVRQPG